MYESGGCGMEEIRFLLTDTCNYNCIFCHGEGTLINAHNHEETRKFDSDDYKFIFSAANKCGIKCVTLTGGEPCMRDDLYEITKALHSIGHVTLVTNASKLMRYIKCKSIQEHVDQFNISLHTMDNQKYKEVCKSSKLAVVLDTIKFLRQSSSTSKIHLNTVILKGVNDSWEEASKIIKFADSVGALVKFIELFDINAHRPDTKIPESFSKMLEEHGFEFISNEGKRKRVYKSSQNIVRIDRLSCAIIQDTDKNKRRELCKSLTSLAVTANGMIKTCFLRNATIDIFKCTKDRDEKELIKKIKLGLSMIGDSCSNVDIEDLM